MVDFNIEGQDHVSEPEDFVTAFSPTPAEEPAAASATPLFSLKARRSEILKALFIDLRVPRYENPEIWVRYGPVNTTHMNLAVEKRRKSKEADWPLKANADVLVNSCLKVFAVFPENPDEHFSVRENDPHGEFTKFDPSLARALDFTTPEKDPAVATVRALYMTDGDLVDTTERLLKFSNVSNDEADTVF